MNIEQLREYCLTKKYVTESFPFNADTLVFKVANKMFALVSLNSIPCVVSLKCNPEEAMELREKFIQITAGYHMNKKHWNTVQIECLPEYFIKKMIDDSYDLVIRKLSKKQQKILGFN